MSRMWDARPIYTTIVEELTRKNGSSTDSELFDEVKGFHKEISFREFNNALMKLEIVGKITVSNMTKNLRRVELVRKT
jgi:hypothetical protein